MKELLIKITAVLLSLAGSPLAFSQTYTLNGNAVNYGNGLVRMTSSAMGGQTSTAWSTTKHDLTQPFDMTFDLFFGCENGANGGDGMTFTFQNQGANAIGASGGNLAVFGITPAISIEFDTYDGSMFGGANELPEDHIAIDRNGAVNGNVTFQGQNGPVTNQPILNNRDLEDCAQNANNYYTVRIVWNPANQTLQLYEEGTLTMTYTEDIINTIFGGTSSVYWGFTAATGTASNEQWIAPAGTIIPWECSMATSCCAPYSFTKTGPATICNNPIQLGVSGTYASYKWSTGETTSTIDVSAPGFYSLSVLDNNGCPSIDTFTISPTGPTADLSGDAVICSDGSTSPVTVTLTGVSPWKITYTEDGVEHDTVVVNASPFTFQGTAPTEYELTSVTDNSGCNGQVTGTANISAYPGLPEGHDTTFQAPGDAVFGVTNTGGNYEWYDAPSGGNLLGTGPSYTGTGLTGTTMYYVVDAGIPAFVTKSAGLASKSDPAAVGTPNNPNDQATGLPKAVCFLDFTANSNFTFERITCAINVPAGAWTNSTVSLTITDVTAGTTYNKDSLVTSALATGVQDFLLSINYACIAGHTYRISYEGMGPSIQAMMYWSLVTITPFGTPYHLTGDSELDITHAQAPSTRYPGLFDWRISVGSPAATCGRTPVTAVACTELAVANNATYCAPGPVALSVVDDGYTYNWYSDSTGSTVLHTGATYTTGTINGIHKYYVESVNMGVSSCGRIPVVATPRPALATGRDTTYCAPGPAVLNVEDEGYTYRWYSDSTGNNLLHTGITYTPTISGVQSYFVQSDSMSILSCGRIRVTATPRPGLAVGHDSVFCAPVSVLLEVDDEGYDYHWYTTPTGGSSIHTGAQYNTPVLNASQTYYVESDSMNILSCGRTPVLAVARPSLVTGHDTTYFAPGSAVLEVDDDGLEYYWYTTPTGGSSIYNGTAYTTPVITGEQTYYVETDSMGYRSCSRIAVTARPCADLAVVNDTTYNAPGPLTLTVDDAGGTYNWYADSTGSTILHTGTSLTIADTSGIVKFYIERVVAGVELCGRTPIYGVPVTVEEPLEAFFIPNLVTPNKDGRNDWFEIKGLPESSKLEIFNRWGDKVFASTAYDNKWDGDNQSDGVYFFDLMLDDGKTYKGWVQLVR